MTVRMAVAGCQGRMGRLLIEEVRRFEDLSLAAGFDLLGVGELIGGGVVVSDPREMAEVLRSSKAQVLIDFTAPAATVENVRVAAAEGVAAARGAV